MYTKLDNERLIIYMNGEIDHHKSEEIRKEVKAVTDRFAVSEVIFDFDKMSFMDSSGIGLIIGRYRDLYYMNTRIILANVDHQAKKLLTLGGIFRLPEIICEMKAE